jgi:hypothetical protein
MTRLLTDLGNALVSQYLSAGLDALVSCLARGGCW